MTLRVLVIAPKTDLVLVEAEVAAVVNYLRAILLNGDLTADDVLNKLEEQWDVIWFAAHGDEEGIHLSDGPLSSSLLTSFIRTAGASLVVFNTCSSFQVAQAIYNELLIDLVCTIRPIPDREAFFTGKQFAIHLGRGLSPHEAYLEAKLGGNKDYVFMNRRERATPNPAVTSVEMAELSEELRRLVDLMDGNKRDQRSGLLEDVRELAKTVARMESDMRFLRMAMWVMAASSVLIALILIGVLVSGGGS